MEETILKAKGKGNTTEILWRVQADVVLRMAGSIEARQWFATRGVLISFPAFRLLAKLRVGVQKLNAR